MNLTPQIQIPSQETYQQRKLFNAIKLNHKLDFKQNIAFERITSLFILKSLENEYVPTDGISLLFPGNSQ